MRAVFQMGLPTALSRWSLPGLPRGSGLAYSAHHIRTLVLVEEVGQAWRSSDSDAYAGLQPFGGADAAGWRGTAGQLLSRW